MRRIKNVYHFDNKVHHAKLFADEPNSNPLYKEPKPQLKQIDMVEITDHEILDNMPF